MSDEQSIAAEGVAGVTLDVERLREAVEAFDKTMEHVEPWVSGPVAAKHRALFITNLAALSPTPEAAPDSADELGAIALRVLDRLDRAQRGFPTGSEVVQWSRDDLNLLLDAVRAAPRSLDAAWTDRLREAVIVLPGYAMGTTYDNDSDSVTTGMEQDDGGAWQGHWVQKGVVTAALDALTAKLREPRT